MRAIFIALALAGCTHVASYERGKLANRTMTTDDTSTAAQHVYAVHEGATGGSSVGGAGCGCN